MTEPARLAPPKHTARAASQHRWPAAFAERFYLSLIIGLVWLGPAWWDRRFAWAMVAWDLLALAAWLADFRRLPFPQEIEVSRAWLGPLSLGVESSLEIEVRNYAGVSVRASLIDDLPLALCAEPPQLNLDVPGRSSARGVTRVRPRQRGDVRAGRVFLRLESPLKLAQRWAVADLSQAVRIYPDLEEPRRHTLYLIRSRQVELEKRFKRQRGLGREFESLREYREGDEPRDVCWTATARRARLVSKVYQVERSQTVLLTVDAGRLMLARVGRDPGARTKLDHAANAALTLAHVALHSGDRVGLLAYGRRPQARVGAGRGAAHLRVLVDRLALVHGELVEADHAAAADLLLGLQKQRALVVWLTDLAETAATPEVIEATVRLARRHLVLFAALGQPLVEQIVAREPGSVPEMYLYTAAQEMIQRRELLLRRQREQGILAMELEPGRLSTALVNEYLRIKERSLL